LQTCSRKPVCRWTTRSLTTCRSPCDKLAAAIAAYGDGAGLAADHPLHALKALHKDMTDKLAARTAKAAADEEEKANKAAAAEGDDVTKAAIQEEVNKALSDVTKKLEAAEKRATDAETIAKSERELREVEAEKSTLRKFAHVTVDVEKDAPVLAKMRATDKPGYDFLISKMEAADAVAKKAALLMKDLGSPLAGDAQTAWAEIEAEAAKIVEKNANMTQEKAIAKVMELRPDLVTKYNAEKSGAVS
jgi:hypothetical protein